MTPEFCSQILCVPVSAHPRCRGTSGYLLIYTCVSRILFSTKPCLLKQVAPQEENGGLWVGDAVGFHVTILAYKISAGPVLSYGSEAWTFGKQVNGALLKSK